MLACTVMGGSPEPRPRRERSAVFPPAGHALPWPRTCGEPVVGPLYPEEPSWINPPNCPASPARRLVVEATFTLRHVATSIGQGLDPKESYEPNGIDRPRVALGPCRGARGSLAAGGRTNTYRLTADGLTSALVYSRVHYQVLYPLTAHDQPIAALTLGTLYPDSGQPLKSSRLRALAGAAVA
jgi:hypothetical protein